MIPPGPEVDPETGAPALWFSVPGKLHLAPVPLRDVVAITVHDRVPPTPVEPSLRRLVSDLFRRTEPVGPPPRPAVTDENPLEVLALVHVLLERDDDALAAPVLHAIEAALPAVPHLSDHRLTRTGESIRGELLMVAPNGPDRAAADDDLWAGLRRALPPLEELPGVAWADLEYGDR